MDLPRLSAGEARAFCIACGPIELEALTLEYLPTVKILHFACGNRIRIVVGPETKIAVYAHSCGHAIAVPYREGQEPPPTPGCASLHGKGGGVI